ncbi:hypothetical protein ACLOJK_011647 [Asimina triloba]
MAGSAGGSRPRVLSGPGTKPEKAEEHARRRGGYGVDVSRIWHFLKASLSPLFRSSSLQYPSLVFFLLFLHSQRKNYATAPSLSSSRDFENNLQQQSSCTLPSSSDSTYRDLPNCHFRLSLFTKFATSKTNPRFWELRKCRSFKTVLNPLLLC